MPRPDLRRVYYAGHGVFLFRISKRTRSGFFSPLYAGPFPFFCFADSLCQAQARLPDMVGHHLPAFSLAPRMFLHGRLMQLGGILPFARAPPVSEAVCRGAPPCGHLNVSLHGPYAPPMACSAPCPPLYLHRAFMFSAVFFALQRGINFLRTSLDNQPFFYYYVACYQNTSCSMNL